MSVCESINWGWLHVIKSNTKIACKFDEIQIASSHLYTKVEHFTKTIYLENRNEMYKLISFSVPYMSIL